MATNAPTRRGVDDRKSAAGKAPKLFVWTVLAALLVGLLELGLPLDDAGRSLRNLMHKESASGDIVLIKVDKESLDAIGAYNPWPREVFAEIIEEANALGTEQIFFDMVFAGRSSSDDVLEKALLDARNVTIAATENRVVDDSVSSLELPEEQFERAADLGSINAYFNFQSAAWQLAYTDQIGSRAIPTFASKMAGVRGEVGENFLIDYSIQPQSVPSISVVDLLEGRVDRAVLEGKTAIVGIAVMQLGDQVYLPGTGRRPGVYVQILGAETLKKGRPIDLGWLPAVIVGIVALAIACWSTNVVTRFVVLGATPFALFFTAIALEMHLIFVELFAGIFAVLVGLSVFTWRFFRSRGYVNALTNLPNLAALRSEKSGNDKPLIAARVHNFAEISSTLNADGEKRLVEQIAARLALGRHSGWKLYQGDEGIFAWFVDPHTAVANHLEALHALFRSPVTVEGQPFDVAVSFGVEMGSGRSLASRLNSALVAADEAENDAIKWKYHDPARLESTPWKLSMLSQLEDAIENGEVWIALQPKVELKNQRVVGAEALARWTHPEKGPISPLEFVAAAEQSDRIGKLTHFVLEEAGKAAVRLRRIEPKFSVAVNLSARMLNDRHLTGHVLSMLDRYDLPPEALTLELTETAALAGTGADIELLSQLRSIGINISIDDYGTGLSTLDYLKRVPANELKIDQSFIRAMRDNRSDMIMVQSTIALAHSLGRTVVAEGVEDKQVLEQLIQLDCDQAQGFAVGRPMTLKELDRRLTRERDRRAA
ncbi:EAL domain-containing protein [Sphingomicrobium sp. XHP0239]|uniref:EAL domain-containing protein n=1 Tax=Sphingomicrobium maritimum TaxID=3133972 RepID=UPI0031CC8B99